MKNDKAIMDNIIRKILNETGNKQHNIIPILQEITLIYGYLPFHSLKLVSKYSEIPLNKIVSVATFYTDFRLKPCGKHKLKVCIGTACHIKGAEQLFEAFKKNLNIYENDDTDKNELFTVSKVACLGCCMLAPAVQIDNQIFGPVEQDKVDELLNFFLNNLKEKSFSSIKKKIIDKEEIRICLCSSCSASGSKKIYNALLENIYKYNIHVKVKAVSCSGMSYLAPLLQIYTKDDKIFNYGNVTEENIIKILVNHFKTSFLLKLNNFVDNIYNSKNIITPVNNNNINDYISKQFNIVTYDYCNNTPADFEEYISNGGFETLKNILKLTPEEILSKLKKSNLRGRGGAGFPTYVKWELTNRVETNIKYVICNADEGDPGAFMDRMLLESFPYRIIEGMMIAAFTIKATNGIIYVREEYSQAVEIIRAAINTCKNQGIFSLIGNNFDITIFRGAGAFVCGEETALISSLEGNRGIPKPRPPFPVENGYFNYPTLINNVETFANITWIFNNPITNFLEISNHKSSGTKTFALAGKIKRPGLIEVPMGITINDIIYNIAGGPLENKTIKSVQIGGPSGGCLPAELFDLKIDFDSLNQSGAIMGSGGLVVLDNDDCMVDIALYFIKFAVAESCGKCSYCRLGLVQVSVLLQKICDGEGTKNDIDELEKLCYNIQKGSFCGLGKTAPNPVLTTLKYFYNEYEEHIQGKCRAGKCKNLIKFEITDDCIGCTICSQNCSVEAIDFKPYERHFIIQDDCVKCGVCKTTCSYNAIKVK